MDLLERALVGLGLLAAGCGFVREPTPLELSDEQVLVHSVLHAGTDTIAVLLQRIRPGAGSAVPLIRPISAADVRITGGSGEVHLREAPVGFRRCGPLDAAGADPNRAEPGCYAAVIVGGVEPGGRYELAIALPGGGTVRGTAVVPEAPALLAPARDARVVLGRTGAGGYDHIGDVPVRWSARDGTGGVQLGVLPGTAFKDGEVMRGGPCDAPSASSRSWFIDEPRVDSISLRIFIPGCSIEPGQPLVHDSIYADLLLTAFDTAYTRYQKLGGSNETVRREQASAGISGALGVFAGAATARRGITLVPTR